MCLPEISLYHLKVFDNNIASFIYQEQILFSSPEKVHFRAVQILFSLKSVVCVLEVISGLQLQFRFTLRRQNNFEYTLFDAKNSHLIESLNKKQKSIEN